MKDRTFLELLEEHRHEFFCFVKRSVWNDADAEDVFCAAVTTAYENRQRFRPNSNFRAWMYKILVNKCFVSNRESRRAAVNLDAIDESLSIPPGAPALGSTDDPERLVLTCGDEVVGALGRLRTVERSCLLLLALSGYSNQEIADIVEIPPATVMTHLARGRAKLREWLGAFAREQGLNGRAGRAPSDTAVEPAQGGGNG